MMKMLLQSTQGKFTKIIFLLIALHINVGYGYCQNQEDTLNFQTPEGLILSYIKTLSKIKHPADFNLQESHIENVLKHYVNEEFNTVLLSAWGRGNNRSEIAEKQRQTEEGALIVTENLLNRLSIDGIDLSRSTTEFSEIILHDEEKPHPDIDFARVVVNLSHKGSTYKMTFMALAKYKERWYFTAAPIAWNEEVLSSWLPGLRPEIPDWDQIDRESLEEEYAQVTDWEEKVLLKNIYTDWIARGRFRNVKCDTLYYTDKIEEHIIDSTIKRISDSRQFKIIHFRGKQDEFLVLSESEQNFLINELEKLKTHKWNPQMFPDSKMVTHEEINQVFNTVRKLKTSDEVYMCSIIYTFSNPIKIRDGQYALYLHQEMYRANYTQLYFSFFIKISDRWENYATVYLHFD